MGESDALTRCDARDAAVLAAASPTMLLLLVDPHGPGAALLTLMGLAGATGVAVMVRRSSSLPIVLWPVIGFLTVAAVARAPLGSHDLWSYAFYGRVVARYGADPYTSVAKSYPRDLVYPLVGWRNTPSVYGPLFSAYSAVVARFSEQSLLWLRLGFQLLAAASVVGTFRLLERSGQVATVALIALKPFVWVTLVNGGHNDALMAAVLLLAVLAFRRERVLLAAALIAAASLIKLSAVLMVFALVASLVARRRWSHAVLVGAVPVGALLMGGLLWPGSLTNASEATAGKISIASVWRSVELLTRIDPIMLGQVATLTALVLVAVVSWARRRDESAALSAGASMSLYGLTASYSLPWYAVWGLPTLALSGDLLATGLVAARGSIMMASYQLHSASLGALAMNVVLAGIVPTVLLVGFLRQVIPGARPGLQLSTPQSVRSAPVERPG